MLRDDLPCSLPPSEQNCTFGWPSASSCGDAYGSGPPSGSPGEVSQCLVLAVTCSIIPVRVGQARLTGGMPRSLCGAAVPAILSLVVPQPLWLEVEWLCLWCCHCIFKHGAWCCTTSSLFASLAWLSAKRGGLAPNPPILYCVWPALVLPDWILGHFCKRSIGFPVFSVWIMLKTDRHCSCQGLPEPILCTPWQSPQCTFFH